MIETWYVMEDGSFCDPRFVVADEQGVLRHQDGRPVAYGPHGPRSRSVETADMQAEPAADPKPRRPYKTRESKVD